MGFRLFLVSIFLVFNTVSWSKTGVLDRIISVDIKSTPVKTILRVIEQRASVKFSYNPDLIDENRVVSLSIQKKSIRFGLSLIFNKSVRFKEVGNHIVLLKNEDVKEMRERKKSHLFTIFRGVITDKRTGDPVIGASVYDIDARYAAISTGGGFYELKIPKAETIRSLYIRKKGYREFVFVVDATVDSVIVKNVSLEPRTEQMEKIEPHQAERIYQPIEERVLSGGLVSYDTYVHAENLDEIEEVRIAQISLVPSVSIGSNLSTNGLITNNFSLNLLAGYSNGVDGAEVGGILNMVKGDVRWVQLGGIANMVGGDLTGFQGGGIANSVRGDFFGAQTGGIGNMVGGDFLGVQAAGIANLSHRNFKGFQVAGISSITRGHVLGFQSAGIFSAARCGFFGAQASGIANLVDSTSTGLQVAGIHNASFGTLNGGQLAGISNYSKDGTSLIQAAGIMNFGGVNKGVQVAGIFNFAKRNSGLQIGLINTSIEGNGMTIGLFNFVKKGYHKTEVSINEIFPLNLTFKSGVRRFYNTYNFSIKPGSEPVYAAGLGFGSNFNLKDRFSMSIDISAQMAFDNNFENFEFEQLYRFSTTVDCQLAKWVTVFAGPTFNVNVMQFANEEGTYSSDIAFNPIYDNVSENSSVKMWIGGQFGFRF